MSQFERDLKETLKRREPPPGFAERVLAHTYASEKPGFWGWRGLVAVAALVLVMVGGGAFFVQEQRRQAEADQKKEQLMAALRITGSKLRLVDERLSAIRERLNNIDLKQE
jgi:anti-sigma-K factor RskA